ncbi:MAG: DUF4388 domain-containing protein [Myxococcales bacterium]
MGVRRPVRFYRVDELIHAYTDDLSERGVFVRTDAWLPVNGVVDLCVKLGKDMETVVPARVAYCLPPEQARALGRRAGIGFQFLPSQDPGLSLLRAYIRKVGRGREVSASVKPRRVLIGCPYSRFAKRLRHALSTGFELTVQNTLSGLLEAVGRTQFDAVVVDEALVGHERIPRFLRESAPSMPPLLLVAWSQDEMARLRAYQSGAADCLPRPFTDEELRLRVQQLVSPRRRKSTPDIAGALARMPASSVLSLLEHERRSGALIFHRDAERVRVSLHEGNISAVDERLDPDVQARLLGVLGWKEGYFEFRSSEPVIVAGEPWPVSGILLERARIEDEHARQLD